MDVRAIDPARKLRPHAFDGIRGSAKLTDVRARLVTDGDMAKPG